MQEHPIDEHEHTWSEEAEELLTQALDELGSGIDPIPTTCLALAALYRDAGEAPDWIRLQAEDLTLEADDGPPCICPPELVARGGFKGGCPAHRA